MSYRSTYTEIASVIALALVIAVPLSVHAGVFSAFFDVAVAESEQQISHEANAQTVLLLKAATHPDPNPVKGGGDIIVEEGALVPDRSVSDRAEKINTQTANGEISIYIVREGDTLSQIAEMFDVSGKTVLWANDISDPSTIHPGDSLIILPITGVRHIVKKGDTIKTIAKKYNGDVEDILAYNQLASGEDVVAGDTIVIPDGTMSAPASKKTGGGGKSSGNGSAGYTNPLPGSVKTQGIHGYNGVDLSGVPLGSSVVAAADGSVIVAKSGGYNGGYGSYVVIKHPNGTQTLYAHLSSVAVSSGQSVVRGQKIGGMGNSGRSTGAHLHFEVRGARNPF